jgi:hypothetical protein
MPTHTFEDWISESVSYKRKFKRHPPQWVQDMTASDSAGVLAVANRLRWKLTGSNLVKGEIRKGSGSVWGLTPFHLDYRASLKPRRSPLKTLKGLDLQNLPFDPAKVAGRGCIPSGKKGGEI